MISVVVFFPTRFEEQCSFAHSLVHFEAAGKKRGQNRRILLWDVSPTHMVILPFFCWLIFVVGIRGIIKNSKEQGQFILYLIKMKIQLVKDFK